MNIKKLTPTAKSVTNFNTLYNVTEMEGLSKEHDGA